MKKEINFFDQVYEVVSHIPRGRVTSYGAIAHAIGAKSSARMVGYAMNDAHNSPLSIPAHRVVNRLGILTGKHHFGHGDEMKELLEAEGHIIVNDRIQDFKNVFWNPVVELSL